MINKDNTITPVCTCPLWPITMSYYEASKMYSKRFMDNIIDTCSCGFYFDQEFCKDIGFRVVDNVVVDSEGKLINGPSIDDGEDDDSEDDDSEDDDIRKIDWIQALMVFLDEQYLLGIDCAFDLEIRTYSWFNDFIASLNPDQKNKIEELVKNRKDFMVWNECFFGVNICYNQKKHCCIQFRGIVMRK